VLWRSDSWTPMNIFRKKKQNIEVNDFKPSTLAET